MLAKNLEDAKKKSEELAALKEKTQKEAETAKVELAATLEKAKAEERAAAEAKAQLQRKKSGRMPWLQRLLSWIRKLKT